MVKLLMQFPNFIGSKIYDGTKHEVDAIDCVRYSSTNIYITIADHGKYHSPLDGHCYKDSEGVYNGGG